MCRQCWYILLFYSFTGLLSRMSVIVCRCCLTVCYRWMKFDTRIFSKVVKIQDFPFTRVFFFQITFKFYCDTLNIRIYFFSTTLHCNHAVVDVILKSPLNIFQFLCFWSSSNPKKEWEKFSPWYLACGLLFIHACIRNDNF